MIFIATRRSSPSRGTWIEMLILNKAVPEAVSRPPHGGRGLKSDTTVKYGIAYKSSPSRGTWIEILWYSSKGSQLKRRPPHGGRGLK